MPNKPDARDGLQPRVIRSVLQKHFNNPGYLYLNIAKGGFSLSIGRISGFTVTFSNRDIRFTWGLSVSQNMPYSRSEEEVTNDYWDEGLKEKQEKSDG